MKKTLIALMALAGMACGADAVTYTNDKFNAWYTEAIAATSYTAGNDYTLTFTLADWPDGIGDLGYTSGIFIYLTKDWGLFTQAGQYLAFDDSTTNDRPGLTTSTGSYTSGNTATATGGVEQGAEGWFYTYGNSTNNQIDTVVTLSCVDGVDSVTITKGDTAIANFTITGDSVLNAAAYEMKDFRNNNGFNISTAVFTANGVTVTIPEPATATLSLLALAGLAARRRRK